jgi:hypothetical protein
VCVCVFHSCFGHNLFLNKKTFILFLFTYFINLFHSFMLCLFSYPLPKKEARGASAPNLFSETEKISKVEDILVCDVRAVLSLFLFHVCLFVIFDCLFAGWLVVYF